MDNIILYNDESIEKVDNFILYLKKYYKKIYFDTWIVNEYQILTWYIEKTEKLFDEIIKIIDSNINKWYFWNILEINKEFETSVLIIKVRSYSIKVTIKKTLNYVLIDDIEF